MIKRRRLSESRNRGRERSEFVFCSPEAAWEGVVHRKRLGAASIVREFGARGRVSRFAAGSEIRTSRLHVTHAFQSYECFLPAYVAASSVKRARVSI